jgi:hypothetical protein
MSNLQTNWEERRKQGFVKYLLLEGIIKIGGPFAVVMQIVGVFILRDETQTFGQYFAASRTWVTFFLHATLFGGIMGIINWRRGESGYLKGGSSE